MYALILSAALAASPSPAEAVQIANAEAALTGKDVKQDALILAGARAKSRRGALTLVLDDGKTLRMAADAHCKSDCSSYNLAAFLPSRGVFVVKNEYMEGYDFILVEMASGQQHKIDGPPHFSPDGKRFVTCRVDEMNGGGTRVWRVVSGRYVQEWSDDRMSICHNWKDNDTFALGVYAAEPSSEPRTMTLTHKGEAWQLR